MLMGFSLLYDKFIMYISLHDTGKNKKTAANPMFATGRSDAPRYHPYSPISGALQPQNGLLLNAENGRTYFLSALRLGDDLLRRLHGRSHLPRPLFASADRYSCPSSPFGFIIALLTGFVNNFCPSLLFLLTKSFAADIII
jgi:hypothetical protein